MHSSLAKGGLEDCSCVAKRERGEGRERERRGEGCGVGGGGVADRETETDRQTGHIDRDRHKDETMLTNGTEKQT